MKPVFDETLLESHDFYHARYGRSALIVAVQRDAGEEQSRQQARWQLFMARRYMERHLSVTQSAPAFDRVLSINEEAGYVRIRVLVVQPNSRNPRRKDIDAEFERVLPLQQVTLEIVRSTGPREQ